MVTSRAATVDAYLDALAPERRAVVAAVRDLVNAHLPPGYEETMAFGMPTWVVRDARVPGARDAPPLAYVALAAQKAGYSLYLTGAYVDPACERALREAYAAAGRRLDLGKSCLRFKRLDDLLPDAVARAIAWLPPAAFVAMHDAARGR